MAGGYDGLKTSLAAGRGSSRCVVEDLCENKNKVPCYEASPHERALKPTEFTAFAEFQSRKLHPGETVHIMLTDSSNVLLEERLRHMVKNMINMVYQ